jgi:hypothetical protein
MTYPYLVPGSQADPTAFVANTTMDLGSFDKALDQVVKLTVDYSQLPGGFTIASYSFRVSPGGEPQLWVSSPALAGDALSFTIKGGISGRAYELIINAKDALGMVRSDMLTINVFGDDCDCATLPTLVYPAGNVSADGSVIVNTAPRFFVSATFPVAPNVLDRWYDTTTGEVYDYVSNGLETYWLAANGNSGGGGGSGGGSAANIVTLAPITPDSATTQFTLSASGVTVNVSAANTLFVSVDGVWQEPVTQYATAGNLIQFTQPPLADSRIFMLWFAPPPPPPAGA